jgi:hypothetical protein
VRCQRQARLAHGRVPHAHRAVKGGAEKGGGGG